MDDRKRTLAAISFIIGVLVIVAVIVGALVTNSSVVSPIPEDSAIRIIFVSPTQIPSALATPSASITGSVSPSPKR